MRILVSHPGRHGDILWSLPTVRAIARYFAQPVDFVTSYKYRRICDLLLQQRDYIHYAWGDPAWVVEESAPISPRQPPSPLTPPDLATLARDGGVAWYARDDTQVPREPPMPLKFLEPASAGPGPARDAHEVELQYDHIFHLGYDRWPELPLALEVLHRFHEREGFSLADYFNLNEPWIKVKAARPLGTRVVALGWSEEWIELKMGVSFALAQRFHQRAGEFPVSFHLLHYPGARHAEWEKLLPAHVGFHGTESWLLRAQILAECRVFVGCLSGLWVLANALGLRTVIMEPELMRHNKIFWSASPLNKLVTGNDGMPTFDARHVGDALEEALELEV